MLAAWLHNIDPYAIKLWEGGPIRWYGLSYLVGFVIAYGLVRRVLRVGAQPHEAPLSPARAADFIVGVAIGIVVGGRLGYVLFYQPSLFVEFTDALPYWSALAIHKGGMASHGGMIGGVVACLYFARRHRQPVMFLFDLFAFGAPLGLFFGRIANFINGELYGRACDPDFPLAVKFPQELYELPPEQVAILGMPPDRAVQAVQAGNPRVIEMLGNLDLLTPRHPSQLYAAVLEGLIVFAVLAWFYRKPVKPGVIGAAFAMTYAVMRIINEFFRMPDEHLRHAEFAAWGITRGQWLSVLLLMLGAVVLTVALRRGTRPTGGWGRRRDDDDGGGGGGDDGTARRADAASPAARRQGA